MFRSRLESHERETAIHWDDEKEYAEIYTSSPNVYMRLIKEGLEPFKEAEWDKGKSWWFKIDKKAIRVKPNQKTCYIAGTRTAI